MTTDQKNLFQAQTIVAELRRRGVTRFVICPGSHSSALVLALSLTDGIECVVHHDERGAGYYAVGYARATGRAAAVVTTSGTAAVNLFPSIVEASQDNLPLIALTADRPSELHDRGANQTIEQTNLFGAYVRFFADLPCPDDSEPEDAVRAAAHACEQSKNGPVHLNCRYREPLVPPPDKLPPFKQPDTHEFVAAAATEPELSDIHDTVRLLKQATRGLVVVGHLGSDDEQRAVQELAAHLGWPIIADITSGLGGERIPQLVHHHDLIFASQRFTQSHTPDTILHLGGRLTSKRLLQLIERSRPANYLFNAGRNIVYDPDSAVTKRTGYDTAIFCRRLGERLADTPQQQSWNDAWRAASEKSRKIVDTCCNGAAALTEPALTFALAQSLPDHAGLFLASSMPIRDMNMFAVFNRTLPVASNRGASGIDGTIAAACGFADGLDRPVTLLIGDQALLHDLSSLTLLGTTRQPVTVVVVNNYGGRIFESLPISEHVEMLDQFFINRHTLVFEKIAEAFDLPYFRAADMDAFRDAYGTLATSGRSSIIEVSVDPVVSREHRNKIVSDVAAEVDSIS
jgi:2-succinyl-5-enolpyruvyl-6-hydroxy-3-cyclohexene-1-carboxylate synthase